MLSTKYLKDEWPLLAAIAAGGLGFALEHAAVHAGGAALWALFGIVLAAVIGVAFRIAHLAEVLAVRLGEPYGTLILTVSAVSVEVVILVVMLMDSPNIVFAGAGVKLRLAQSPRPRQS